LCDENGIGGGGEYCGDNIDALLDHVNAFYYEASSGRYVPRAVSFDLETGMSDAVRAAALGWLFRSGNLVNHTRGENWAKDHYARFEHKFF